MVIEVVADCASDAAAAQRIGAHRIELGAAPTLGGLTPTIGTLLAVKAVCALPVVVLVRPRPGGFHYDAAQIAAVERDAEALLAAGADGIVFGYLNADGTIDEAVCRRLVALASGREAIFHRAFDVTPDRDAARRTLAELGVRRILTSGGAASALAGAAALRGWIAQPGPQILPAGGIRAENVREVIAATGCDQIHLGPRRTVLDPTTCRGDVDYGAHSVLDEDALAAVIETLGAASVVDGAAKAAR